MTGMNFLTGASPFIFLVFFVPGAIILYVRSQLTTGRLPPPSERFLSYLILSTIYLALTLPFIDYQPDLGLANLGSRSWIIWLFMVPIVVGLVLALTGSHFRDFLMKIGLKPVHPIPSAWDWKFSNVSEQWVLVTLSDGSQVAGLLGVESFVSDDPAERDIYIDQVYTFDPNSGKWTEAGRKSILVAGGQVKTVEFWPYDAGQESGNEDS